MPPYFAEQLSTLDIADWVVARLREGEMLVLETQKDRQISGLLFLFVIKRDDGLSDLRIGYLFHQDVWGQGLASELLKGFVSHCAAREDIASIAGGVEKKQPGFGASVRKKGGL